MSVEIHRISMWITPCKRSATRGMKPSISSELRRSSTYNGFSHAVELLRSSRDGTQSVSPSCATLTRGYQHLTPSELYSAIHVPAMGQARNDGADRAPKSRRDDTLLTDGFNRRTRDTIRTTPQSRRDDTCAVLQSAVPSGLCRGRTLPDIRRLKPSVNKVPSLRDFGAVRIAPFVRRLKPTVNQVASFQDFSASHTAITRGHAPLLGASLQDFSVPHNAVTRGHAPLLWSSLQDFAPLTLPTLGSINKGACPLAENHQRPTRGGMCTSKNKGYEFFTEEHPRDASLGRSDIYHETRHPIRDASLSGCRWNLSLACSTERCIPNGIRSIPFFSGLRVKPAMTTLLLKLIINN